MKMRNAECGMRNGRGQRQNLDLRLPSPAFRIPHSAFRDSAFTLVEILASLLFLAIAVPAIIGAFGIASRTSEVAERSSIAGGLAENKLNEMLVDNAWQSAAQSNGDFGADFPAYRWQMSTQTWARRHQHDRHRRDPRDHDHDHDYQHEHGHHRPEQPDGAIRRGVLSGAG